MTKEILYSKQNVVKKLSPKDIQKKVHNLEMQFFPRIIERIIDEDY